MPFKFHFSVFMICRWSSDRIDLGYSLIPIGQQTITQTNDDQDP